MKKTKAPPKPHVITCYYVLDVNTDLPSAILYSPKAVASFIGCHLATVYRILDREDTDCNGFQVFTVVFEDDDMIEPI